MPALNYDNFILNIFKMFPLNINNSVTIANLWNIFKKAKKDYSKFNHQHIIIDQYGNKVNKINDKIMIPSNFQR